MNNKGQYTTIQGS